MRTSEAPGDGRTVTKRWTADDRRIHCRPAVIDKTPGGHRRDIGGVSADNFVICRENRPVAKQSPGGGRQATAGWFYDIVQGQENRPTSYRSRKIGIRQKIERASQDLCFLGTSAFDNMPSQ